MNFGLTKHFLCQPVIHNSRDLYKMSTPKLRQYNWRKQKFQQSTLQLVSFMLLKLQHIASAIIQATLCKAKCQRCRTQMAKYCVLWSYFSKKGSSSTFSLRMQTLITIQKNNIRNKIFLEDNNVESGECEIVLTTRRLLSKSGEYASL